MQLFKNLTLLFSKAEVPLIAEALPLLYDLHRSMEAVVKDTPPEDDSDNDNDPLPPTPAVIRIAARASIILIDKYINLMKESKLYLFVISIFYFIFRLACN